MGPLSGTRLGVYQIGEPIGAGGMGQVYHAIDTTLDRAVALKILPDVVATDPDRLARFEREAKLLAALNHPHIAAVFGFERSGPTAALIMELVDGEDLAQRIARGPIPLDEALPIARQMAEALEAAHDQGIVHRDLKPANIKVRPDGTVKVLDFGLAKAMDGPGERGSSNPTLSPTITSPAMMTGVGVLLGTAAYMSPEQARGRSVDRRADIWAFGVVLFEMLTGIRAFDGEDLTGTLAYVITREPDWNALPKAVPPAIRTLLRRCLEKEPKKRLQAIGDARIEIDDVLSGKAPATIADAVTPAVARQPRSWLWIASAAVFALAAVAATIVAYRATRPVSRPLIQLTEHLALQRTGIGPAIALSRDGARVAYVVRDGTRNQLATRRMEDDAPRVLAGTEEAAAPFFSPDGLWIGFFTPGQLKKISVSGGSPIMVTPIDGQPRGGGFWTDDKRILFALQRTPILSVPDAGGKPTPITTLDASKKEVSHRGAQLLSDDVLLYEASADNNIWDHSEIIVESLKTHARKTLISDAYGPGYLPGPMASSGHLLYMHDNNLFAAPFTPAEMAAGTGLPVLDDVSARLGNGIGHFAVARNGALAFVRGNGETRSMVLGWFDETGKATEIPVQPGDYRSARLSPDGSRIAITIGSGAPAGTVVAIYEVPASRLVRLPAIRVSTNQPVWAPDGQHIAIAQGPQNDQPPGIYWWRTDGTGRPVLLVDGANFVPESFSPDGKTLLYSKGAGAVPAGLWAVTLDLTNPDRPKTGAQSRLVDDLVISYSAAFSPDGHWIAYSVGEPTRRVCYVIPFPGPGGRSQISADTGGKPQWLPNRRELIYLNGRSRIMVVPFTVKGDVFVPGQEKEWAPAPLPIGIGSPGDDVAPDGKRLLVVMPTETANAPTDPTVPVTFLINFADELARRVPP